MNDEELFTNLGKLPVSEPGDHVRGRARGEFVRTHSKAGEVAVRFVVPAMLASIVGVYLTWAITTAAALMQ